MKICKSRDEYFKSLNQLFLEKVEELDIYEKELINLVMDKDELYKCLLVYMKKSEILIQFYLYSYVETFETIRGEQKDKLIKFFADKLNIPILEITANKLSYYNYGIHYILERLTYGFYYEPSNQDYINRYISLYLNNGFKKNWTKIVGINNEIDVYYKNLFAKLKAIKDGSAECLKISLQQVVKEMDVNDVFQGKDVKVNFYDEVIKKPPIIK